ncbi:MAG: hypothetical protein JEZ09_01190 [Salinivirgaceae bacterium]|nr:hypothetical protein [Salinivirgaceae bacterium]
MKNLIFIFTALLFTMCNIAPTKNSELQIKNDSLERLMIKKDSAIYSVIGTFNAIENNLETIKSKEKIISLTLSSVENQKTREERINSDINLIYELMLENKEKVAKLEQQLKQAYITNNDLRKTIQNLQAKLAEKNAEIIQLRQHLLDQNLQIDELNYALDTLSFDNKVKTAIIEAQEESLNTAYYIIGSEKELKEMAILDKKGLFIGIGSGKILNEDFDKKLFTAIDIQETKEFSINAKKIRVISKHPSNSYEIIGEKPAEGITIKNQDDFWSISKYLVVVVD